MNFGFLTWILYITHFRRIVCCKKNKLEREDITIHFKYRFEKNQTITKIPIDHDCWLRPLYSKRNWFNTFSIRSEGYAYFINLLNKKTVCLLLTICLQLRMQFLLIFYRIWIFLKIIFKISLIHKVIVLIKAKACSRTIGILTIPIY